MNLVRELLKLNESAGQVYGLIIARERGEDLDDHGIYLFSTEEKRTAKANEYAKENGYDTFDEMAEDDADNSDKYVRNIHFFERTVL